MPLVIGTRYHIPFLLNKQGVGNYVTGEIYEVDDQMMEVLDNLEDCQRLYKRDVQPMNLGIDMGWVINIKYANVAFTFQQSTFLSFDSIIQKRYV